jgi:hypothetical protein
MLQEGGTPIFSRNLSNTATPKYYGQFRDAVMRGDIPVNREISLEMNRIDQLIRNPNIYYDDQAVEGFLRFCEGEMTLTEGSDLHLLFTFKLWGGANLRLVLLHQPVGLRSLG